MEISLMDYIITGLFLLPIAVIVVVVTPYDKKWTNNKRSSLINKAYEDSFNGDKE